MHIRSRRVYIGSTFIPAVLEINDGKISAILPYENEAEEDYGADRIVPGFIDIHTHGGYGFDTNSADPDGLKMWMKKLAEEGVTSFLPTTVTAHKKTLIKALENAAAVKKEKTDGAEILGVHLEGPFIDEKYHGAQPLSAVQKPTIEDFKDYQEAAQGLIRVMTMAVEKDENFQLTRYCAQHGVVISMGHSAATISQAARAIANGAKSVTHTFNGMSPFHHRENGLAAAALRYDSIYSEIICDGNHVTPEVLNIFFKCKGKDKGIMVTDSLMCKGYESGREFEFAGLEVVIYSDGSAHLKKEGIFAGSTLKMNEGLKVLAEKALVPFDTALNACTINPACLLKEDNRKGRLAAGYDADIVVLADDYSVIQTYCMGIRQM